MARIGIVADVHANLPALEAVLALLEAEGVERILCCGDLVGYGPWPRPVLARLQEAEVLSVQGNHDAAAAGSAPLGLLDEDVARTLAWTRQALSAAERAYLAGLPERYGEGDWAMVHGSLRGPLWEYLNDSFAARETFALLDRPLCFFGHSHVQGGFVFKRGAVQPIRSSCRALALEPGARYLVNPGSVGQPRDGDARAACAVLDLGRGAVRFRRAAYVVSRVAMEAERVGLTSRLLAREEEGR
jgi:predicted phosphodiesterase